MTKTSDPLRSRIEAIQTLERWLPRLLENLSLARGQIAIDQIRSQVMNGQADRILAITSFDDALPEHTLAVCLLVLPDQATKSLQPVDGRSSPAKSDTAVVVHAGPVRTLSPDITAQAAECLKGRMEVELAKREINFVQWATDDAILDDIALSFEWCDLLGFDVLANLEYMTLDIDAEKAADSCDHRGRLRLRAVNADDFVSQGEFRDLVEATYRGTLDCPRLNAYRSVDQTLDGYRTSPAFTPEWWFLVDDARTENSVGAIVLARHIDRNNEQSAAAVIEIVYMGLDPLARGKGLGSDLISSVIALAKTDRCERAILAVDRENSYAKTIYLKAGFEPMLKETVWGRRLHR